MASFPTGGSGGGSGVKRVTPPDDFYWALADPDELCHYLVARRDAFFEFTDSSPFFNRIRRTWNYYHGLYFLDSNQSTDLEIQSAGEDGEIQLIAVNHLRSVLHLILTYATQNRPVWDSQAINSDHASLEQAKLMNQILDDTWERKRVEPVYRRAVEHSLVLTAGYWKTKWDQGLGKAITADPKNSQVLREGDIGYWNPTIMDVIYDFGYRDYTLSPWQFCRTPVNVWDLVARHPELKRKILDAREGQMGAKHRLNSLYQSPGIQSDLIDLWEFYHMPTEAVPKGRYYPMVGDECWLEDGDYDQYSMLPVRRICPMEYLLTSWGYTPAFDVLGLAEMVNAEFSTILTNHANLAPQKIWIETGDQLGTADLDNGATLIQSRKKPEPLNLVQTPPEIFEALKACVTHIEYVSGVNSVARGQPEPAAKSGTALALIDQKAMQFNSVLVANTYDILGEIGTLTAENFKLHRYEKRVISIAGRMGYTKLRTFDADGIQLVERVRVKAGNPLTKTLAGRIQYADKMGELGLLQTKEEYDTLLETGRLEPLTRSFDTQLSLIHEENEELLAGRPVEADITDHHVLHILEHQANTNSVEVRRNPLLMAIHRAHQEQHFALLADPEAALWQGILGYQNPIPPNLIGSLGPAPQVPGSLGVSMGPTLLPPQGQTPGGGMAKLPKPPAQNPKPGQNPRMLPPPAVA